MKLSNSTFALLCFLALACAQPDVITVSIPNLYPEGIVWSAKTGTLLSSTTLGIIHKIKDDGTATPFATDSRLTATVGLHIDDQRNELLVCNRESFLRLDLDTGAVKTFVDLTQITRPDYNGTRFANDVVNDAQGNAYVTDTRMNVVYKITEGVATIFTTHADWINSTRGLNGIEIAGGGRYLLVGDGEGKLYKVSLQDPTQIVLVQMNDLLLGLDGLTMRERNGDLVVVGNSVRKVYTVRSNDDWTSASIVFTAESKYPSPTTATLREGHVYVNHAYFGIANQTSFEIERIQDMFVPLPSGGSNVGAWLIILLILAVIFLAGAGSAIFYFIRRRQQRYREFKSSDLATTEFDEDNRRNNQDKEEEELNDW